MNLVTPEFGLLFWQAITFFIVLFLLSKFAWKPIMSGLKEREQSIDEALSAAAKAKEEIKSLQAANENLLQEARVERDRMLKEAQTVSNTIIAEAKDKAAVEVSRMQETARIAINNEKQAAITEMKNLAASLSIEIAEKILKKELNSPEAQRELVDKYIQETKFN